MLWFELATKDGCTVEEAQARYSIREFIEWAAFDRLRGIRIDREAMDAMLAQIAYYTAAPHLKNPKSIKPVDLMLWKPKEQKRKRSRTPIDPAKMEAWMNGFIAQQSAIGNVKRG